MDKGIKVFVGLDVHKDSMSMGVAQAAGGEARFVCTLAHDVAKLIKLLGRYGQPSEVRVVYEAGPTGYGLYRALIQRGYGCQVIAPSLIPKRAGVRIKTDRRDGVKLAGLSRAGELTAVWVPDEADEAMRDLVRAREDAVEVRHGARMQLKAFLLRQGVRYSGKTSWGPAHARWLATLSFARFGAAVGLCRVLAGGAGSPRTCRALQCRAQPGRGGLALRTSSARADEPARVGPGQCAHPSGRDRGHCPL